jgi:hypothetical protein
MKKNPPDHLLKEVIKEAVAEALHEQREYLEEVIADVLQEMALVEALREVEASGGVRKRRGGFGLVEGEA